MASHGAACNSATSPEQAAASPSPRAALESLAAIENAARLVAADTAQLLGGLEEGLRTVSKLRLRWQACSL